MTRMEVIYWLVDKYISEQDGEESKNKFISYLLVNGCVGLKNKTNEQLIKEMNELKGE